MPDGMPDAMHRALPEMIRKRENVQAEPERYPYFLYP
jgi:hypothetical protein